MQIVVRDNHARLVKEDVSPSLIEMKTVWKCQNGIERKQWREIDESAGCCVIGGEFHQKERIRRLIGRSVGSVHSLLGEMVQLCCILITHFAENLTKLPTVLLHVFLSGKSALSSPYFRFSIFIFHPMEFYDSACFRQKRTADMFRVAIAKSQHRFRATNVSLQPRIWHKDALPARLDPSVSFFPPSVEPLPCSDTNFHGTNTVRLSPKSYRC